MLATTNRLVVDAIDTVAELCTVVEVVWAGTQLMVFQHSVSL